MLHRFICALAVCFALIAPACTAHAADTPAATTPAAQTAFDFTFFDIDGNEMPLKNFSGKVLLVVNTATGCGFAGQFKDLQKLADTYGEQGLVVIGVPSNDFGGQEPLDGADIKKAVQGDYGATFTLTQKTAVSGAAAHPFYTWAAQQNAGGILSSKPRWNFHKYLIGRDGKVAASVAATTNPSDKDFIQSIETALAQKAE